MDIQDILFSDQLPADRKRDIISLLDALGINNPYLRVLVPTDANDDINGSQHVSGGGTDFTYRDATLDDVLYASSAGVYDYFSEYAGRYTGHYYNGSDTKFQALVFDPPAYAASHHF